MSPIHGTVAPGFERVADEFARNFAERGDLASSCVVERDGVRVVDLWGGSTPSGQWGPDSRSVMFSVSKGVTTICLLMAAERGLLDLDERVAHYWPEYGVAGKDATTVRQVLAHRAGLPGPDVALTAADLAAWTPAVEALAAQAPAWRPGTAYLYHAITVGWLAGEVLRRATGLRPGAWLAQHIADPLGLAMTFGLSDAAAAAAHVPLLDAPPAVHPVQDAPAAPLSEPLVERALSLGGLIDPVNLITQFNRPDLLAGELPAANLVTTARSLARLYSATIGEVDGVRLLRPETVADAARVQSEGRTFIGTTEINRWGTGFMLPSPRRPMLGPAGFGHDGAGGQLAFADPVHRIAFAYQTALPSNDLDDDRANALCRAVAASIQH